MSALSRPTAAAPSAISGVVGAGANPYITHAAGAGAGSANGNGNGKESARDEEAPDGTAGGEVVVGVPEITAVQGIVPTLQ